MVSAVDKKLFLGGRLRRLRRELGVTQSRMAEDLGVSASYLNHLEHNQRPFTAQILLRLAEAYDIDMRSFSADIETSGADSLSEVFADALFADIGIARHELAEVAENSPTIVEGITRLYQAYRESQNLERLESDRRPDVAISKQTEGRGKTTTPGIPSDWVRDYIQSQHNFFPELEDLAQTLLEELGQGRDVTAEMREVLESRFSVQVKIIPATMFPDSLRRYDHHRKRLFLSEVLSEASRQFAIAYQLALLRFPEALYEQTERAMPPGRPIRSLLRVSLVNYLAAAILMPYESFHSLAESSFYDLNLLSVRFDVSYEQACHRLTTLGRPNARGVPFFMLRIDQAGNISKRFAGGAFPFSRFGGTCPRWSIHSCFKTPARIVTQIIETLEGQRYFTLSRSVPRDTAFYAEENCDLAVGLGCELKFANRLIYSRGMDLAAPIATVIGPACRICERPACPQRASEPINRVLDVEDAVKSISPYPFTAR